jgi:hypothetical protein
MQTGSSDSASSSLEAANAVWSLQSPSKPGVAFITEADDGAVTHPLNRGGASAAGNFSYRFYALSPPSRRESINQPINFKGENNET